MAFALAMDALAVAIASGIALRRPRLRQAGMIALCFGGFQAAMPVVGWFIGRSLHGVIAAIDHWVAFGLLAAIGLRMIHESRKAEGVRRDINPLEPRVLLLLGIATSIDALAVGVSLALLGAAILMAALTIGLITFGLSLLGVFVGRRLGRRFGRRTEFAGGMVLIGLGLKILVEHTLL